MIDDRDNAIWTVYVHIVPKEIRSSPDKDDYYDKYYVGITKLTTMARWGSHGQMYNKQGFWNAIQKYGWENIQHEVIAENLTEDEAEKMEIILIDKLGSFGKYGYNNSTGGNLSYCMRRNLVGQYIKDVHVDSIAFIGTNGVATYNCTCKCGNKVLFDSHQLLYTNKKYICCKECEKKQKKIDCIKDFRPNHGDVTFYDSYFVCQKGNNKFIFDNDNKDIILSSSITYDGNKICIYNPSISQKSFALIPYLFNSEASKSAPIFKNGNKLDLRRENVEIVDMKTFVLYNNLLNGINNPYYRIQKKDRNGILYYLPSFSTPHKRKKSTTDYFEAIQDRNKIMHEIYSDNKIIKEVLNKYYPTNGGDI